MPLIGGSGRSALGFGALISLGYRGERAAAAALSDLTRLDMKSKQAAGGFGALRLEAGRALGIMAAGVPGLMFGRAILNDASKFQLAMAQVKNVIFENAEQMLPKFRKQIMALVSSGFEQTPVQIAEGFRVMQNAGFTAAQSMQHINTLLNLNTAGGLNFRDAMNLAMNVVEPFGLGVDRLTESLDKASILIRRAPFEFSTLRASLAYAARGAGAMNATLDETLALMGIIAPSAGTASKAGMALSQAMIRLAAPTGEAREVIKKLGLEFTTLDKAGRRNIKPITGILEELAAKTGHLDTATRSYAAKALLGVRGQMLLTALLNSKLGLTNAELSKLNGKASGLVAFKKLLKEITTNVGQGNKSLAAMAEELRQQEELLRKKVTASWEALRIELGDRLLPIWSSVLKGIKTAIDGVRTFSQMFPKVTTALVVTTVAASALMTTLGGFWLLRALFNLTLGKFLKLDMLLKGSTKSAGGLVGALVGGFKNLPKVLTSTFSALIPTSLKVAGIKAARPFFQAFIFPGTILKGLLKPFGLIMKFLGGPFKLAGKLLFGVFSPLKGAASLLLGPWGPLIFMVLDAVGAIDFLWNGIKKLAEPFMPLLHLAKMLGKLMFGMKFDPKELRKLQKDGLLGVFATAFVMIEDLKKWWVSMQPTMQPFFDWLKNGFTVFGQIVRDLLILGKDNFLDFFGVIFNTAKFVFNTMSALFAGDLAKMDVAWTEWVNSVGPVLENVLKRTFATFVSMFSRVVLQFAGDHIANLGNLMGQGLQALGMEKFGGKFIRNAEKLRNELPGLVSKLTGTGLHKMLGVESPTAIKSAADVGIPGPPIQTRMPGSAPPSTFGKHLADKGMSFTPEPKATFQPDVVVQVHVDGDMVEQTRKRHVDNKSRFAGSTLQNTSSPSNFSSWMDGRVGVQQ